MMAARPLPCEPPPPCGRHRTFANGKIPAARFGRHSVEFRLVREENGNALSGDRARRSRPGARQPHGRSEGAAAESVVTHGEAAGESGNFTHPTSPYVSLSACRMRSGMQALRAWSGMEPRHNPRLWLRGRRKQSGTGL
jgi:hypothetical protein